VKPHVLIVEDNELVTGAMRILFEETGHRVSVAHTVEQALAAGIADAPDLVLLDLTLPDGDGLEVVRAFRARGIHPQATLALTGRDDEASLERCAAEGVSSVFLKPVASRELLAKAREWLDAPETPS
jgi:DNA-binding response OmpR family regulator